MIYLECCGDQHLKEGRGKRIGQEKKLDEDVASGDINPQPELMKSSGVSTVYRGFTTYIQGC